MPLARIVTRSYDEAIPLAERLRQYGYTVEIFSPDQLRLSEADLEIEVEAVPIEKALKVAGGRARKHQADIFVERGVYSEAPAAAAAIHEVLQEPPVEREVAPENAVAPQPLEAAPEPASEALENMPADAGEAAVEEAVHGSTESWRRTREHAGAAVSRWAGKFAAARAQHAAEREEQRRIREQEEELRRQERETEQARQALAAEQARHAAEEERRRREQELAIRRQQQEEERRRLIAEQQRLAAERKAAEEEERRRAVAEQQRLAAEREAAEAERQALQPAQPAPEPAAPVVREVDPAAAEMEMQTRRAAVPRPPRPRPAVRIRPRAIPSLRQRQWQRAALYASIGALVIMIGFALAMRQSTPFSGPSKLLPEGAVQEQVPFGPATAAPRPASPGGVATPQQRPAVRQAPASPNRPRSRNSGIAEDEVIVHHYASQHPAAAKASTTAGVRHYSDMDNQR